MQFDVLAAPTVLPLNANASVTLDRPVGGIWHEQDALASSRRGK
jgi:hypothetical protein